MKPALLGVLLLALGACEAMLPRVPIGHTALPIEGEAHVHEI